MKRPSFDLSLKKGECGERIITSLLESKGFVVYKPVTNGSHAFDMLAIKDKERSIAIDVKAKSRRTHYNDTGVNQVHFECYQRFSERHLMPFWLFFVDEHLGSVYGNNIEELEKPIVDDGLCYPLVQQSSYGKAIRYWSLSSMITFGSLEQNDSEELKSISQRNYNYPE